MLVAGDHGGTCNSKCKSVGEAAKCDKCKASRSAPKKSLEEIFNRDKFLLKQKHLSINQNYTIWDEQGQPLLYASRPSYVLRNLLSVMLSLASAIAAFAAAMAIAAFTVDIPVVGPYLGILLGIAAIIAPVIVLFATSKKSEIFLFTDEQKTQKILEVVPAKKFMPINQRFLIRDHLGESIGYFNKNIFTDFFLKRWFLYGKDGSMLCFARESSIVSALLRRYVGNFFGLLRLNFNFHSPQKQLIGNFNRKFTLLDRYVLDLSKDSEHRLDRKLGLVFGVLLDTGEKR